jgi:hypothetical protein
MALRYSKEVIHPHLGRGRVVSERWRGMYLQIKFERGPTLWVNRKVLELKPTPSRVKKTISINPIKTGEFNARRIIEALRVGIVPYFALEEFTFGREEEIKEIDAYTKQVEKKGGAALIIEGEYGSGKTHLFDYLYLRFLKQNYGVARVELDGQDVSPAHPKHVYRELVRSLTVPIEGEELNFRELLEKASELNLPSEHIFLSKAIKFIKRARNLEIVWSWLEGESLSRDYLNWVKFWKLPVLLDHIPAVDLYCYLISGISFIVKELGCKGLVILVDEAESLFGGSTLEKEYGYYFYQGLVKMALNEPSLGEVKLASSQPSLGKRDIHGYIHSGVRPLPYIYHFPTHIFLILGLTPSASFYYDKVTSLCKVIKLNPLRASHIKILFQKLISLYEQAFSPFKFPESIKQKLSSKLSPYPSELLRSLIRVGVESMDIYRHYYGRETKGN